MKEAFVNGEWVSVEDTEGRAAAAALAKSLEGEIASLEGQVTAIASEMEKLGDAIAETNTFVGNLIARIENTDMTYAEKLKDINDAITVYTESMRKASGVMYKSELPIPGMANLVKERAKTISFMDIVANMTKISYGHTMVECVKKDIDIRIPDADIATATKEALGIENLRDPDKLLAWVQTLGMISNADLISAVTNGYLSNIGIDSSMNAMYRGDMVISYDEWKYSAELIPYRKNLAEGLDKIYKLPHQAPTSGSIGTQLNGYPGHRGIDYPVSGGTAVYATTAGFVSGTRTGILRGGVSEGNYVTVVDKNGNTHHYAHLTSPLVANKKLVLPGEKIGTSGNTGNSTGGNRKSFTL